MTILFADTETYCEVPINNGTFAYAEKAEVMLFAYALDDAPVEVCDMTDLSPGNALHIAHVHALLARVSKNIDTIMFHNSGFDRTVIRYAMGVDLPLENVHCTMTQALMHSMPGALGALCELFKLPLDTAKDKHGKSLVQLFCKPRPKNMKLRRATRETHPLEWASFIEYARLDVAAMRAIYSKMPRWNLYERELDLWRLDTTINNRGIRIDTELAEAAIRAVDRAQHTLADRTLELTGGELTSTRKRDALLKHLLAEYGVSLPDLQASTLERRLNDPTLPWGLRELLAIRLQVCTTSTTKYRKLLKAVSSDGRLRGTLQFCGASRTGRWAGRTFQPQNLPSQNLPDQEVIDYGVEALLADCADLVQTPELSVMKLTSATIRSCLSASEGKKLCVADLSNIEGRIAAWLAKEEWKLQAFRDFDAGIGEDIYKLAYANSFKLVTTTGITKHQRQIGKVQELGLGFGGGVGAFLTFAAVYDMDLDELTAQAWHVIPPHIKQEALGALAWARKKGGLFGLEDNVYVVCDSLKRMWREAHPNVVAYWAELEQGVRNAIAMPGTMFRMGYIKAIKQGAWLKLILPSGRVLSYANPHIERGKLAYMGVNQYTRQWTRVYTYSGKLFENCVQATAREVMAWNMPGIDEAGYEMLLTCHDELLTETDDNDSYTADTLADMMASPPPWALDLPLAASGFETYRYRK